MPELGDEQDCTYPGCKGKMVLKEGRMAAASARQAPSAGAPFPTTKHLHVWFCELNPWRHVEVPSWGMRPVKDCSMARCAGVMIHSDKGRIQVPEDLRKRPGKPYPALEYEAGWVCIENDSHFESEA